MKKGARWTEAQLQQFQQRRAGGEGKAEQDAPVNRNKYGNVPVVIDGIVFQSTKEGDYYKSLKILQRAGKILKFERQVAYKIKVKGKLICKYIADFVVWWPGGRVEVIDVKGEATAKIALFQVKKKLMEAAYGIVVKIV